MFYNFFPRKSSRLWGNIKNSVQADESHMTIYLIRHMHFACRKTRATTTHSESVTIIAFRGNDGSTIASEYYVILVRTFPVLYYVIA
jgi:hypothetical protein